MRKTSGEKQKKKIKASEATFQFKLKLKKKKKAWDSRMFDHLTERLVGDRRVGQGCMAWQLSVAALQLKPTTVLYVNTYKAHHITDVCGVVIYDCCPIAYLYALSNLAR